MLKKYLGPYLINAMQPAKPACRLFRQRRMMPAPSLDYIETSGERLNDEQVLRAFSRWNKKAREDRDSFQTQRRAPAKINAAQVSSKQSVEGRIRRQDEKIARFKLRRNPGLHHLLPTIGLGPLKNQF